MNKQEAFDKACGGIIAQGKKSVRKNGYCVYRADDGCKCAIGHLISSEEYDYNMEGKGVKDLRNIKSLAEIWQECGEDFLIKLQHAHDRCEFVVGALFIAEFKEQAQYLALDYNLNTDSLN